jgi:hypothetical protein
MARNTVQETASLHEKAVQAVASGDVQSAPQRPRRSRQSAPSVELTKDIKAHPEALKAAKKLISPLTGYTKIDIVSNDTVIVR